MSRRFLIFCSACLAVLLFISPHRAEAKEYVPQEVLIQLTPEGEAVLSEFYKAKLADSSESSFWEQFTDILDSINPFNRSRLKTPEAKKLFAELDSLSVTDIKPDPSGLEIADAPTIKLGTTGLPPHLAQYGKNTFTLTFENGTVVDAMMSLKQIGLISHVQPNYIYRIDAVPNDPRYYQEVGHDITSIQEAWDITTGSEDIVIAIIDTGTDYRHEDLSGNMWSGIGEDIVTGDGDPDDIYFHGTAVAGVAGAVGNNAIGVAGVAWNTSIMAVRIGIIITLENGEEDVTMTTSAINKGIRYAADNGADILNLSFGGGDACRDDVGLPEDTVMSDSISYAVRVKGAFVAVGAGNDSINGACDSPTNHPDVIGVAALNNDGTPAGYTNYGPLSWKSSKFISAPGDLIVPIPGNRYAEMAGTSFAAPYVAGAAALVLSIRDMDPFELRQHLIDTADEYEGIDFTAPDGSATYGKRLNVYRAVTAAGGGTEEPTATPTPPDGGEEPTPTPTPVSSEPIPTATPVTELPGELIGQTQQVDWVFGGVGRCWSAWAEDSCSLTSHEGGAYESLRDLDSDGTVDITCSQGDGSGRTTTITNISDSDIVISCERYACTSCASGDGVYARCDQSIDASATKVSNAVTVPAGCSASCSLSGATGSCIGDEEPTSTPVPTPTPTPLPDEGDTDVPTPTPTPFSPATSRAELPLMLGADHYQTAYKPVYSYGWFTDRSVEGLSDSEKASRLQQQIDQMRSQDAIKIMMTSSYATTQWMLENYAQDLKDAGITIIGYNMELAVGTPESEINAMHRADETNSVVTLTRLAKQYGFETIWGPIRANTTLAGKESQLGDAVRLMKDAGLRGVAFQEQKFIETQTAEARRDAVIADVAAYNTIMGDDFEVYVQVMSSRCGSQPWTNCMQFLDYIAPHITGIAVWASGGSDSENLPAFINTIRGTLL
ncbi:MAG: S8 family serine peptidase [Candidatus Roizmanbacteria bacterium]|nr:S8 family serine peptidase [Candidatus Roizmanbacteria bacterium]